MTLIIGLMAVMAFPAVGRARIRSHISLCINNLRQIEAAKDQWSLEANVGEGVEVHSAEIAPFIRGSFPQCPSGGVYDLGAVGVRAECSIAGHELP